MTRRTIVTTLVLLTALALAARVGTIVYLKAWKNPSAMEHRYIAKCLVDGGGFSFSDWGHFGPTSVQSPPYPFLLAGLFKIFGTDVPSDGSLHGANLAYFSAMLLNSIAGALMVYLTYQLARTIGATQLAALLAAAAVAVWPTQIYAARPVQAVAIITAAMTASIILFYRAVRSGAVGPWVGFSILATIATLTEPVYLPALMLSGLLVLVWRNLTLSERLRNAVILGVTVLLIIGPWAYRNYRVHGKLVPIKDTFWVNVWKGNNEYATGTDRLPLSDENRTKAEAVAGNLQDNAIPEGDHQYDILTGEQKDRLMHQNEMNRELVFKELATTWIKAHPAGYLRLCWIRFVKTLTVDRDNPKSLSLIYIGTRFVLLGFTIVGLIIALRQRWSLLLPGIIALSALATYTLTVTAARFSIPFEPLQLCLAGGFLAWMLEGRADARPSYMDEIYIAGGV